MQVAYQLDKFQPALPMRGVTGSGEVRDFRVLISTRTPHAGSDILLPVVGQRLHISTRTPHAGSDENAEHHGARFMISTRTPHAGSDAWRTCPPRPRGNFNPHSPCGE